MTLDVRQSRNRLSAILDNMPFLAWLKDADGRLVAVNRPFALACGKGDPSQVIGRTDLDLWPPKEALTYIADHEQVMRSGQGMRLERELLDGNRPRWLEIYKAPVFDADGRVIGSTGFSLDVTERKLAEQEQERLQLQLRQAHKMEILGQMSAGIAHDFNNILTTVLGYANLAQRLAAREPEGKMSQYLGQIQHAGERARDLVASMVAYSRTQPDSAAEAIDPAPVVRDAAKLLDATIPSSIEIHVDADDHLGRVKIVPDDLRQILVKLVINARDAMGETGRVDIALRRSEESGRACSICHQTVIGHYLMLEVSDTGPGIAADVLPRIFDPFFTTKGAGQGSGMGLSMVQGLIRKANGHVVVQSKIGQGTVFQVLMPVAA
jgi:PAS domain S-box-containing protein